MTSNSSLNPPPSNPTADYPGFSTSSSTYLPSVPISVYRELVKELQATQAQLDSLKAQNQRLVKHNRQLQQEVAKVVRSAQDLQKMAAALDLPGEANVTASNSVKSTQGYLGKAPVLPSPKLKPPASREVLTIDETQSPHRSSADPAAGVNGPMLAIAIGAIVLAAFGAGFLLVRPLLNHNYPSPANYYQLPANPR